jgi:hypothetical protein
MNVDRLEISEQRLPKLSNEAARIANLLTKLSAECPLATPAHSRGGFPPDTSCAIVRSHIRARRLRARFSKDDLFAEPAWGMMLDLFASELSGHPLATSSLCIAAAVPMTTALRWIKVLVEKGVFVRRNDPRDGRRVFIQLSDDTRLALKLYFAAPAGTTLS